MGGELLAYEPSHEESVLHIKITWSFWKVETLNTEGRRTEKRVSRNAARGWLVSFLLTFCTAHRHHCALFCVVSEAQTQSFHTILFSDTPPRVTRECSFKALARRVNELETTQRTVRILPGSWAVTEAFVLEGLTEDI